MKATRIATIERSDCAFFVTVSARMIEGHYQCISHPPFGKQPAFGSREAAMHYIFGFGVEPGNVTELNP